MPALKDLPKLQPCLEVSHHWWQIHPQVGVFIGVLALVGVLVPWLRGDLSHRRHERAFWSILMFLCLGLEINSIYQDQTQHTNEEALARCEQLHNFNKIAERIEQSNKTNAQGFATTIDGLKETLNAATAAMNQTRPQAYLEFTTLSPRMIYSDGRVQDTLIVEAKTVDLTVHYQNAGNDAAQVYAVMAQTYVGKPDDLEAEKEAYRKFDITWLARDPAQAVTPLSPGVPAHFSFKTNPISGNELTEIQAETMTIYYIVRLAYRDKTGDWFSDTCSDLQKPATNFLGVGHFCRTPGRSRYKATRGPI